MTREEAARVIESHAKHGVGTGLFGLPEAFTMAIAALRGSADKTKEFCMMANQCICCGQEMPEGDQVCGHCRRQHGY